MICSERSIILNLNLQWLFVRYIILEVKICVLFCLRSESFDLFKEVLSVAEKLFVNNLS